MDNTACEIIVQTPPNFSEEEKFYTKYLLQNAEKSQLHFNGHTKIEIDFILIQHTHIEKEVLYSFDRRSDHKMHKEPKHVLPVNKNNRSVRNNSDSLENREK